MTERSEQKATNPVASTALFGVWQPIETMPKDRPVLVWSKWDGEISGTSDEPEIHIAEGNFINGGDYYAAYVTEATHWMPLPSPPSTKD